MNTATSPATKEMLISKGLGSFINGSYHEASNSFEEILSNSPNDADALHHLAGCQIQLHEYEAAQKTIQKVLNSDYKNYLAWFRLGQIHYNCKRYESAIDSFGPVRKWPSTKPPSPLTYESTHPTGGLPS
jgi:tetratricopeptide (TPR) repeat protein